VTSKDNIDKVRFIRPTGLATPLPVSGIKMICNYYRNLRNELKAKKLHEARVGIMPQAEHGVG
jgi:hypothetical protein